jgi:hypothetical protein
MFAASVPWTSEFLLPLRAANFAHGGRAWSEFNSRSDPNGFGSATIIFPTATSVCFGIVVHNIGGPTAAHIHSGASGINGPQW